MHYLASYDIHKNRYRNKAAKLLLRYGFVRVQLSVYFNSKLTGKELKNLRQELKELLSDASCQNDSVLLIPIEKDHLASISLIGEERIQEACEKFNGFRFF
ncbi:CRISPR-associated endonuclease Cas2 [Rapidithrix thailandica]|uniref:CRISPR-associated endoribonuclease Cas2 n=1 Tax=Rapidithrix thailandica TaxID=413964 RepID=A0AAW9RV88_9BACT